MSTKLMEESLIAFDLKRGFEPNLRIFRQARFIKALSPNGKMVLFPNVGTAKIIKTIMNKV